MFAYVGLPENLKDLKGQTHNLYVVRHPFTAVGTSQLEVILWGIGSKCGAGIPSRVVDDQKTSAQKTSRNLWARLIALCCVPRRSITALARVSWYTPCTLHHLPSTLYLTLCPLPSTLNPQTSTPLPSVLCPQPSTLNPQPSSLYPLPSTF